jgi:hypothetical protein
MNIEKAKKRIAKQIKRGVNGYPAISLEYFGATPDIATEVVISFTLDEASEPQAQKFICDGDAREDETIQSTLVKIIERADASTVTEVAGVSVIS